MAMRKTRTETRIWDIYVVSDGQTVSMMEGTSDQRDAEIANLASTGDYGVLGCEALTADQYAAKMKRLGWC